MKTKRVIQAPFSGFYDSFWSPQTYEENEIYNIMSEYGDLEYKYDWVVENLDDFYQDIANQVCELYAEQLGVLDIDVSFTGDVDIDSPQYYNFRSDQLYATMQWDEDDVKARVFELCAEYKDALSKIIENNHTSYDGFWSFMDNNYDDWMEELKKWEDERYISYTLRYLVQILNGWGNSWQEDEAWYQVEIFANLVPDTEEAKEEWDRVKAAYDRRMALRALPVLPGLEDYR